LEPNILIAPLDWGLGHAARCIPVIRYLLEKGCHVVIAAQGAAAILLRRNFPEAEVIPLKGYEVRYSRQKWTLIPSVLGQVPRILRVIREEKRWLQKLQAQRRFDLIISDNRYGLKIPGAFSVIMTHQLQVKSGAGPVADRILRMLHYRLLEKFDACWVVDKAGPGHLAGSLSHPGILPSNLTYIGWLSQLNAPGETHPARTGTEILVLLSGPEPMRSILEKKICGQIREMSRRRFTVVAGNPSGAIPPDLPSHITYYTHLNADELQAVMASSSLVICRSGYSTLMDLAALAKKALLIPTPGQTEQEYLAARLYSQGLFLSRKQSKLNLQKDITEALRFPGFHPSYTQDFHSEMKEAVDAVLKRIRHSAEQRDAGL